MPPRIWSVLTATALFACAQPLDPTVERTERPIIGGAPSAPGDYPTTGVLLSIYDLGGGQEFGSMTCTGTLIAPDVVMMAAHCAIDFFGGSVPFRNYFSFELDVSEFGMTTMELPADAVEFAELVPHPMFELNQPPPGLGNYYDVGLGFLDQQVTAVTPAVVSDELDGPNLTVGAEVAIVGYGQREQSAMEAGIKHQAISFINEINDWEMQVGNNPPGDPQKCHGDSGGPTYIEIQDGRAPARRVIGITSRAYDQRDCNVGGVDMRADAYRPWFDQVMRDRCTTVGRPGNACANGGGLPLPGGVTPPPDAGFPDVGFPDTGVVDPPDAGTPDTGSPADSGPSTTKDATTTPPITGGGGRRDSGCGCSASQAGRSGLPGVLLLGLLFFGARRRT